MGYSKPFSLVGLTLVCGVAGAGALTAGAARPSSNVSSLRTLVARYRELTWTYERAAHVARSATSYSERRSSDPAYLAWVATRWDRRAGAVRRHALAQVGASLHAAFPRAPGPTAPVRTRVRYARGLALRLLRIYPGEVPRGFASARAPQPQAALWLWLSRGARALVAVARHVAVAATLPPALRGAFLCIHHYEGAWDANTGNGYYGGLQMDLGFQWSYGPDFERRWGTADRWPPWAQLEAAGRAYRAGRGFWPWPNTARFCGLL